jgi:hypothetical protein
MKVMDGINMDQKEKKKAVLVKEISVRIEPLHNTVRYLQ